MGESLLTFREAAQRLNVPESWLREKVAKRQVQHTRLGKHVRFTEKDIEAIIQAAQQPAVGSLGYHAQKQGSKAKAPVSFRKVRPAPIHAQVL
ncbi:helix-turn-helix domain-containing protein [Streptosporangium algeriense]|uniref:Helix-turn-helix domain-containing protein n=1 Tax=Streptosporangium algeriense TaxID=1682748 RepID=A0ABW3DHE8_9ACTN